MNKKQTSQAYADARIATLKEIRALKVGDVIKAFYGDSKDPELLLINAACPSTKEGDSGDIRVTPFKAFGNRRRDHHQMLNTEKWVKVAHSCDVVDVLTRHVMQQEKIVPIGR
jgi:hypothetical protein